MKKMRIGGISALFAAGTLFFSGLLSSCSFLDTDDSSSSTSSALAAASQTESGGGYETLSTERLASTASSTAGTITVTINNTTAYSGTDLKAAWEKVAAETSSGSNICIELASGTYDLGEGQLAYNGSATVEIKGLGDSEYGSDVLIKTALENSKTLNKSEQARSVVSFQGSGNLILENLRIENTYAQTASGDAQLEIIGYDGTGYVAGYNCSFISGQDTMRTTGKAWFYHCYIEGDVDFLWMEQSGKVALYEDCRIRAISGRATNAYFTAPRVTVSSTASYYKGLVVYNSSLEAEDGLTTVCLGRNPWGTSSTIYNNVSIVGCKFYGTLTKEWYTKGNSNSNIIFSGFNTDSYFSKNSNGNVYSSTTVSNEFAGRNNILNRYYYAGGKTISKADEIWDVETLASEKDWSVVSDDSKNLLDGETDVTTTVYPLGTLVQSNGTASSEDGNLSWENFAYHSSNYGAKTSSSSTLTLKISEPSVISWYSYKTNSGAITVKDSDDNTIVNSVTVNMSADGDVAFLYTGSETTLTFSFSGTCYMDNLKVKTLTSESDFVTSVTISGSSTVTTASGSSVYTAAIVAPYISTSTEVIWSIAEGDGAEIDSTSGVLTPVSAGTVVVRATSVADSTAYDEKNVEITDEEAEAVAGKSYSYNFITQYQEQYEFDADAGLFKVKGSQYNGSQHGILFATDDYICVKVAGDARIYLGGCNYTSSAFNLTSSAEGKFYDSDGSEVTELNNKTSSCFHVDGSLAYVDYKGSAGTVTLTAAGTAYVPYVSVLNKGSVVAKEVTATSGYVSTSIASSGNEQLVTKNANDYDGCIIVVDGGKWTVRRDKSDIQYNPTTYVYIPVCGKSKITIGLKGSDNSCAFEDESEETSSSAYSYVYNYESESVGYVKATLGGTSGKVYCTGITIEALE